MTPEEIKAAEKEANRKVFKTVGIWTLIVLTVIALGIVLDEPVGNYIIDLFK